MFTLDSHDWAVFCANATAYEKLMILQSKCIISEDMEEKEALHPSFPCVLNIIGLEIPVFTALDTKDFKSIGE